MADALRVRRVPAIRQLAEMEVAIERKLPAPTYSAMVEIRAIGS